MSAEVVESSSSDDDAKGDVTHDDIQVAASNCSAKWSHIINRLRQPIIKFLHALGETAVTKPRLTISSVITVSVGILIIGLLTGFTVDVGDHLWTPRNSRVVKHSHWISDHSGFPEDYREFVFTFHSQGENILGYDEVNRVFQAMDSVRELPGYGDLCSQNDYRDRNNKTTCEIFGITEFWNNSAEIFESSFTTHEELLQDLSAKTFPDGTPVADNQIFGNYKRDTNGTLTEAQLFVTGFLLPDVDDAEGFESEALDVVLAMREDWEKETGNNFRMEVSAYRSFDDEFGRAIEGDLPLLPVVFIIMSIFTCSIFAKCDKVKSRSLLGFGGVVSVLLSIMTSFGLMFTCGVPFTSMSSLVPFIMFGIGLDDTFIISGCYERTNERESTSKRIHDTIEDCGLSITITTVTSTAAFGLGCISTIPSIFWLCLYAFPTVVIIFLYQMTFFIACVALDDRRIKDRRRDCCVCIGTIQSTEEEEEPGFAKEDIGSGGDNLAEKLGYEPQETTERELGEAAARNESAASLRMSERIMTWYAMQLVKKWVKVLVLVGFAALAVACGISASKLTQAFDVKDVLPNDSYLVDFFDSVTDYSIRSGINPGIFFRYVDQSNPTVWDEMDQYIKDLKEIDAIERMPEFFWLDDFREFILDDEIAGLTFVQQVDRFLNNPVYKDQYQNDIVLDEDGMITASRCFIDMDNVAFDDVKQQITALEDQREVSAAQPANEGRSQWAFFSYHEIYAIWEFYRVSAEELVFTTVVGIAAVTGVAFILIPQWTAAFLVFPLISILYLDLLGVLQWAGVHVNPVSYVALVLSIGLMVDFLMHLLLRYYESTGDREEKAVETLRTMGASILIGGISTFLGTMPLAFSTSDIFITVFYAFLGLVTLGCGHGLILLPVVLSIIGPEDPPVTEKPKSIRKLSVVLPGHHPH